MSVRRHWWGVVTDNTRVSPIIIHAPHGGTMIPHEARREFIVSGAELAAEQLAMTDHATDRFVEAALRWAPYSAVINHQSRLVVDPERFPGPEEEMNAVGMGVLYTHGSQRQLLREVRDERRSGYMRWFRMYSRTIERLVDAAIAEHGGVMVIDVHSYPTHPQPYELHDEESRPELCIGYDPFHLTPELRRGLHYAFHGVPQLDNQPFHGSYVPLKHYGRDPRVQSVMVEIRRDQYMNERTGRVDEEPVEEFGRMIARYGRWASGRIETRLFAR